MAKMNAALLVVLLAAAAVGVHGACAPAFALGV